MKGAPQDALSEPKVVSEVMKPVTYRLSLYSNNTDCEKVRWISKSRLGNLKWKGVKVIGKEMSNAFDFYPCSAKKDAEIVWTQPLREELFDSKKLFQTMIKESIGNALGGHFSMEKQDVNEKAKSPNPFSILFGGLMLTEGELSLIKSLGAMPRTSSESSFKMIQKNFIEKPHPKLVRHAKNSGRKEGSFGLLEMKESPD